MQHSHSVLHLTLNPCSQSNSCFQNKQSIANDLKASLKTKVFILSLSSQMISLTKVATQKQSLILLTTKSSAVTGSTLYFNCSYKVSEIHSLSALSLCDFWSLNCDLDPDDFPARPPWPARSTWPPRFSRINGEHDKHHWQFHLFDERLCVS